MGSKYPVLKPTEIINCLKNSDSNTKAKKEVVKYSNGSKITIIPMHYEVAKGTLKSILELADITLEDFLKKL